MKIVFVLLFINTIFAQNVVCEFYLNLLSSTTINSKDKKQLDKLYQQKKCEEAIYLLTDLKNSSQPKTEASSFHNVEIPFIWVYGYIQEYTPTYVSNENDVLVEDTNYGIGYEYYRYHKDHLFNTININTKMFSNYGIGKINTQIEIEKNKHSFKIQNYTSFKLHYNQWDSLDYIKYYFPVAYNYSTSNDFLLSLFGKIGQRFFYQQKPNYDNFNEWDINLFIKKNTSWVNLSTYQHYQKVTFAPHLYSDYNFFFSNLKLKFLPDFWFSPLLQTSLKFKNFNNRNKLELNPLNEYSIKGALGMMLSLGKHTVKILGGVSKSHYRETYHQNYTYLDSVFNNGNNSDIVPDLNYSYHSYLIDSLNDTLVLGTNIIDTTINNLGLPVFDTNFVAGSQNNEYAFSENQINPYLVSYNHLSEFINIEATLHLRPALEINIGFNYNWFQLNDNTPQEIAFTFNTGDTLNNRLLPIDTIYYDNNFNIIQQINASDSITLTTTFSQDTTIKEPTRYFFHHDALPSYSNYIELKSTFKNWESTFQIKNSAYQYYIYEDIPVIDSATTDTTYTRHKTKVQYLNYTLDGNISYWANSKINIVSTFSLPMTFLNSNEAKRYERINLRTHLKYHF